LASHRFSCYVHYYFKKILSGEYLNKRPKSDHFDGKRFFNPNGVGLKNVWDLIKWQIAGNRKKWPSKVTIPAPPPPIEVTDEQDVVVTFVNHATALIQMKGLNILTDPIWSLRTSPVQWAGPKRVYAPPIPFEFLPPIHLVLISHNHYDHLDADTVRELYRVHKPRFLVALGDKEVMRDIGVPNCDEMDWGDEIQFNESTRVIFTPSQHWSSRKLNDKNKSLWGSFLVIYKGRKIYFAGDTGYGEHFKNLSEKYGAIDLALLPIGAYEPRWFMKGHHMNPSDSVQAHIDLKAKNLWLFTSAHFS
jgi:L-ascorbate metabolism protein UlaG (beta-lactamase superfamily)